MGTNYYAIKKIPNSIKLKICASLDNDLYDEAQDLFNSNYKKVHIGKSSYGWKFIFNYNNFRYYDLTKDSINSFLCQKDIILKDEYNNIIDIDYFWNMVKSKENGLDNYSYYKDKENFNLFLFEEETPFDLLDKFEVSCHEFYSDGLRFSTSTNFS